MSGFLLEKPFPDATSCVLIGRLETPPPPAFRHYRSMLWCIDAESAQRPPSGIARAGVQTLPLGDSSSPALLATVEQFIRRDPRHLPSIYISDTILLRHTAAYQAIIAEIHATLERHHRARVTRQKDGFLWQQHVLKNLPAYTSRRLPTEWAGALRGLPAFVCGAGPSLDASIAQLAAVANRGVIFSADSALRALARRGVTADFAVSIDAAKIPEKCLPPDSLPSRVVLAPISPPAWTTALPADGQFFLSNSQITVDWLAAAGIDRTAIAVTENCGSTGLELARHLGCTPIYLFGLDLATDAAQPTRRHHTGADAALYANSGYNPAAQQPLVPGNYAAEVPTFAYGDWSALDARLADWPAGLVFNVNDRGARFRNVTLVHPDQFSLASPVADKHAALAMLAQPERAEDSALHSAFLAMRAAGNLGASKLPSFRAALARGGPTALAVAFRELFVDQNLSRAMGAFSLKIMPHLVPPIEGDTALWSTLLDEFADLTELARAV